MHSPWRQAVAGRTSWSWRAGGFTLLELCLAICIAVLVVLAAVPSLSGVIEEQRARRLFTQFDDLARKASSLSVSERRPYTLLWDDSGVSLVPLQPANAEEASGLERVDFGDKKAPELQLSAALMKDPPRQWTFWPTGTCEPATIICRLSGAPWTAVYDPLTTRAAFTSP